MACRGFSQLRPWSCCRHESRQVCPGWADCPAGLQPARSSQMKRHQKRWREEKTIAAWKGLGERTLDNATDILLKPTWDRPIFRAPRFTRESLIVNVCGVRE